MTSENSAGSSAGANVMTTNVVITCDVLLILGFFISTAGLLTAALSKRIVRSPQWFLFMAFASWQSIQYLLLVGNQLTLTPPPHILCLVQSASVYAAAPGTGFGLFALFHQIFLLLVECLDGKPKSGSYYSSAFMAVPFMIYIIVFVIGITLGIVHPEQVVRDELRVSCHLTGGQMEIVEAGIVFFACLGIFVMEGFIMVNIWKNHKRIRNFNGKSTKHFSLSLVVRAFAFSVLPIAASIVSAVSMVRGYKDERTSTPAVNIFLSSIPLFAGLLFGTQKDIIDTWIFWKRRRTLEFSSAPKGSYGKV